MTHKNNEFILLKPPPRRITLNREDHPVESSDKVIERFERSLAELETTVNRITAKAGAR